MSVQRISGRIVDVLNRAEFPGTVEVAGGVIRRITRDARGWERPSDHVPVTVTLEV